MAVTSPSPQGVSTIGWRTPLVIVLAGCLVSMLSFGPRSTLGLFLTPMSQVNGWDRDVFGLALAIQNLLWGVGQPFAGAFADRYGTMRVLCIGGILYALGLALMAHSSSAGMLDLAAGVLIGFGLSGCSFPVVLAALGKLLPENWRLFGFGAGTAAGSFGQFFYSPFAIFLTGTIGWQNALLVFAAGMLFVVPLSIAIATTPSSQGASAGFAQQSLTQALREAIGNRSYVLLVLGYFTCGFQLAFITVHMPAFLLDHGISAKVGGWTVGAIGLFNIFGSLAAGWLGGVMPKRYLLSIIYLGRALAVLVFITFPITPVSSILFGAAMGLLWLSTVAPTNGIIAVMFGTRWLATLGGLAFLSHQIGGFLGVWLGGLAYVKTGSYDVVWWLSILFGLLSAVINLPIVEKPVVRPAAAAA